MMALASAQKDLTRIFETFFTKLTVPARVVARAWACLFQSTWWKRMEAAFGRKAKKAKAAVSFLPSRLLQNKAL